MMIIKEIESDKNNITNKKDDKPDWIKDLLDEKESILGNSYIYEGDPPKTYI